jgi:hypothetical protein
MNRFRLNLKLMAAAASLFACMVTVLSATEPDAYTPQTFLYERYSRLTADYMLAVLGRGDAASLTPALKTIHAEIKTGTHDADLEVLEVNVSTLISIAEDLIRSQQSPDRLAYGEEEIGQRIETAQADFHDAFISAPGTEVTSTEEFEYVPPEHDNVYNEAKKDLLDEAYDMLETIQSRKN